MPANESSTTESQQAHFDGEPDQLYCMSCNACVVPDEDADHKQCPHCGSGAFNYRVSGGDYHLIVYTRDDAGPVPIGLYKGTRDEARDYATNHPKPAWVWGDADIINPDE